MEGLEVKRFTSSTSNFIVINSAFPSKISHMGLNGNRGDGASISVFAEVILLSNTSSIGNAELSPKRIVGKIGGIRRIGNKRMLNNNAGNTMQASVANNAVIVLHAAIRIRGIATRTPIPCLDPTVTEA